MRAIRDNREITAILLLSLAIKLLIYSEHAPLWDTSVYILMGKYIYSFGKIGLWEPFRPLLWPLVLGFFWSLGGSPIFWGRILELLFSLGNIFLIYLIGKKVFNKKVGILASLLLGCSPTYFFWGNCLYTGIPSTFFGLLSVYLFFNGRYLLSGILSGVAFLTRFVQLITIAVLGASAFGGTVRKVPIRNIAKLVLGFTVMLAPYLLFNYFAYKDVLLPFVQTKIINTKINFIWHREILDCIKLLFKNESFFLLFAVPGIFFVAKRKLNREKLAVVLIGLLSFLWIGFNPLCVMRYSIPAIPFLYLISAYGVWEIYNYFRRRHQVIKIAFWIIVLSWAVVKYGQLKTVQFPGRGMNVFQRYIQKNEDRIKGEVWISNPSTLVYSNLRAGELIYYPVFDLNRAEELKRGLPSADIIFFDSRDFPCVPRDDIQCQMAKSKLVEDIITQFTPEYYVVGPSGGVSGGVFKQKRTQ